MHKSDTISNPARRVAIYISRELGGYSLAQIGKECGDVSYKAISSSIYRVRSDANQTEIANRLIKILIENSKTISESMCRYGDLSQGLQVEET
jgi:chromosomal replication initiation ATPase DnaA